MNTFFKRVFGIFLVAIICLGLMSGCGSALSKTAKIQTPLVAAYDPFSGNFNPFYAEAENDYDVVGMTQITLLTTDRNGGVVYNAIKGETRPYNGTDYLYKGPANLSVTINEDGTTTYRAELKKGLLFSDGVKLTADDLIFTYYVLCDPSYIGPLTLSSYNIVGLQNYQTQTSDSVYAEYEALVAGIYEAGPNHVRSESDAWTQAQQDRFWAILKQLWMSDIQGFVDYFVSEYAAEYGEIMLGKTAEEIAANDGLKIAFGIAALELGGISENGVLGTLSGKTFDINNGVYPVIEDLYDEVYARFEGNSQVWAAETGSETDIRGTASELFISEFGPQDESMNGQGVPNIAGIKKLDDYTVEVTTSGYEASAVYTIFDVFIAPLHYYGDKSLYKYDENKFGFSFGDLTGIQAKTAVPMGAGAYKFVKYEDKVVFFEAHGNYYKGCPKLKNIQFKEIGEADKITSIASGTADIANPSGSKTNFEAIRQINGGEPDGEVIITDSVDYLGYGYIGMNADTVNVGGNPSSEASANLRKGLATLFAVYRDVAVQSFFGDSASVINYPISNTSWAAPQKSDADYQTAFSKDIDGNEIYSSGMDAQTRYTAALQAAIGFFKAAGFLYDGATGKFTAAPEGAKLAYEVLIPANGIGSHPTFQILSNTAAALETIGFTLNISDVPDSSVILNQLNTGVQEIWISAWSASIDPDMYQIYHSSCMIGNGGSDTNYYHINDPNLDQYLLDARSSADQAYRKAIYKTCLDIILNWAVEVPCYQRQNIFLFSAARVNYETVTPDITTYWNWMSDIERLEVYESK